MPQPFSPYDFLVVAQELARDGADEAKLRTAVGRAYYAMFLIAREKLGVTTTVQVHREVIRVLTRRRKTLGDRFFDLFNLRQLADYELLPAHPRDQDWHINWARAQHLVALLHPALERIP